MCIRDRNTGIGQSTTYTGTIDGAVAITKTGNGTLTLNCLLYTSRCV